ncbi:echinoidin-like protein, partial [Leptotrombidium deliense]
MVLNIRIITFILIFTSNASTDRCNDGWKRFENKCFLLINTASNRELNLRQCLAFNATLVSINSEKENDFVFNTIKNFDSYFWLSGIRLSKGKAEFKWINNANVNYTNWNEGQPNDLNISDDDCLMISSIDGKWFDYSCSLNGGVTVRQLCEKEVLGNYEFDLTRKNDEVTKTLNQLRHNESAYDVINVKNNHVNDALQRVVQPDSNNDPISMNSEHRKINSTATFESETNQEKQNIFHDYDHSSNSTQNLNENKNQQLNVKQMQRINPVSEISKSIYYFSNETVVNNISVSTESDLIDKNVENNDISAFIRSNLNGTLNVELYKIQDED